MQNPDYATGTLLYILIIYSIYYTCLDPITHKNIYLHLYSRAIRWKIVIFFMVVTIFAYDQRITIIIIIKITSTRTWRVISGVYMETFNHSL